MKKIFAFVLLSSLFLNTSKVLGQQEVENTDQTSIAIEHVESNQIYKAYSINNGIDW